MIRCSGTPVTAPGSGSPAQPVIDAEDCSSAAAAPPVKRTPASRKRPESISLHGGISHVVPLAFGFSPRGEEYLWFVIRHSLFDIRYFFVGVSSLAPALPG
jgi:hypothetical protein